MQNTRIELPSPGWKPGILTVVIILLLPICPQFCLHTINIANANCLMPNTEFQMPAPSSQCLIPNALSPSCSRSDTALHTAQTMTSSLHLSSKHQHLCAKGKSRRPSRTLHPHTPLTLNILQQTGVRKGPTKLPLTHICHLQFTKLHEAM